MTQVRQKKGVNTAAVTCTLPKDLIDAIDGIAAMENATRSSIVADTLREALRIKQKPLMRRPRKALISKL